MLQTQSIGTLTGLWRYPVKSMQGERLSEVFVTSRGIVGDRAYALIEVETGYVVSAKHARKWARVLQCRAEYLAVPQLYAPLPPIQITLPDGTVITSNDPNIDDVLSRYLGRAVKLVHQVPDEATREANRAEVDELETNELIRQELIGRAAPPGNFFDYAPLHVLTTSTLKRLTELNPDAQFDERRFRPNMVITPHNEPSAFVENEWLGQTLQSGAAALHLFDPSPRCVITTLPQADLPQQTSVLKTIAQNTSAISVTAAPGVAFPAVVGVYGITRAEGLLTVGAEVTLSS